MTTILFGRAAIKKYRGQNSRCWHNWFPQGTPRQNLPRASLLHSHGSWHSLACKCIAPVSVSAFIWPFLLCVCLCSNFPLLVRTPVLLDLGLTLIQYELIYTQLHLTYFQIRSHSQVSSGHELGGGGTIQSSIFASLSFT